MPTKETNRSFPFMPFEIGFLMHTISEFGKNSPTKEETNIWE